MHDDLPAEFLMGLQQLGLSLQDEQKEQLLLYQRELLEWNRRFNLTAITDPNEVMLKHFLDSFSLLAVTPFSEARLLDIGSGAGFPGLPLKIMRPAWQVTLLEATGKKVAFLHHMIEVLGITDTVAIQGRAEELAHKEEYRAQYDIVTARAVAALPVLLEYCAPYCRIGGSIVLPKKGDIAEELEQGKNAATLFGCKLELQYSLTLPGLDDGRLLLLWKQRKLCPPRFPRSSAAMAKKPLVS